MYAQIASDNGHYSTIMVLQFVLRQTIKFCLLYYKTHDYEGCTSSRFHWSGTGGRRSRDTTKSLISSLLTGECCNSVEYGRHTSSTMPGREGGRERGGEGEKERGREGEGGGEGVKEGGE